MSHLFQNVVPVPNHISLQKLFTDWMSLSEKTLFQYLMCNISVFPRDVWAIIIKKVIRPGKFERDSNSNYVQWMNKWFKDPYQQHNALETIVADEGCSMTQFELLKLCHKQGNPKYKYNATSEITGNELFNPPEDQFQICGFRHTFRNENGTYTIPKSADTFFGIVFEHPSMLQKIESIHLTANGMIIESSKFDLKNPISVPVTVINNKGYRLISNVIQKRCEWRPIPREYTRCESRNVYIIPNIPVLPLVPLSYTEVKLHIVSRGDSVLKSDILFWGSFCSTGIRRYMTSTHHLINGCIIEGGMFHGEDCSCSDCVKIRLLEKNK